MADYINRDSVIELAREYYTPALREEAVPVKAIRNIPSADVAELQKQKWIPVSERLPEPDTDVLIYDGYGDIMLDRWQSLTGQWAHCTCWDKYDCPHFWMPLPEPPKEEKDG